MPDALIHLHRTVEDAVGHHGFAAEARGFKPHLTIARRNGMSAAHSQWEAVVIQWGVKMVATPRPLPFFV